MIRYLVCVKVTIHMNASTQHFQAEHCPKHHSVSSSFGSSHSAPWRKTGIEVLIPVLIDITLDTTF